MGITRFGGRRTRLGALIAVAVLALLLAAGQLGSGNRAAQTFSEPMPDSAGKTMVESGAMAIAPDRAFGGGSSPEGLSLAPPVDTPATDARADRDIIYTGSLQVRADDPTVQLRNATNLVKVAGGRIASSAASSNEDRRIRVVFRVPSAQYESVFDQLSALGKVERRSTAESDVTSSLADVEARLANSKAAVDRMRTLMAEAKTVGEVISVESQLTQRESDYEALKAQAESIKSSVQMATINMTIVGPDAVVDGSKPGFMDGLRSGWQSVTDAVRNVLVAAGFLLPWLPMLALLALAWIAARRSYHRRSAPAQTPTPV